MWCGSSGPLLGSWHVPLPQLSFLTLLEDRSSVLFRFSLSFIIIAG